MPESIDNPEDQPTESKWKKFGPVIFWGTVIALPAMNIGASVIYHRTAKLNLELEQLKAAATQLQ